MARKQADFMNSFAKGLRVIEAFDADNSQRTISQIAAETGLDRATARRCLLTLTELGYADYDGKYFSLTHRVLRLGVAALASMELPQLVQPWLDQLSDRIGQSSSVSILDGNEIVYIARASQRRVMSIRLMPGSRLPAFCTSMGRVLLAALPESEARLVVEASDLSPRTVNSLTDVADIMAELARVRTQGHAFVDQEIELGLRSIAVPLLNTRGQVVAALNAGFVAGTDDPAAIIARYLPELTRVQSGVRKSLH
ncbi:IclR family transcriptional regulator domain-containing protein [Qingshengfaniella alkalisoli]|uniref:Helix-turn-helix domain-containing protein n=1 Tax=Qingshengfaniella alkalisoli TaxID=2599296 RepID=A0A5B8IA36_9RHOB|nr:IclR family transcriptional regulator C-terminal domain-containing protein [Qingshengfaniella alkalisoli]QDY71265.1 helix-turn-helix domain-containing protein [Qingshengfaniella alkalisoli]